jgi:hypothetical protein
MSGMLDVTVELPARMKRHGCELFKTVNGNMEKFILINKARGYRGFIYLKDTYIADSETKMDDLFNNFYYETGLIKVGHAND